MANQAILPVEYAKSLLLVINALEMLPVLTGSINTTLSKASPMR